MWLRKGLQMDQENWLGQGVSQVCAVNRDTLYLLKVKLVSE